jgi:hypothetical protein
MRSLIKLPTNQVTISMKKQFAYIAFELLTKYQSRIGDYLKYEHGITKTGDLNIKVTPVSNKPIQQDTYKFYPIYK